PVGPLADAAGALANAVRTFPDPAGALADAAVANAAGVAEDRGLNAAAEGGGRDGAAADVGLTAAVAEEMVDGSWAAGGEGRRGLRCRRWRSCCGDGGQLPPSPAPAPMLPPLPMLPWPMPPCPRPP